MCPSRCVILFLTAACCLGIPKNSTRIELQRLARLPRVEFPVPLHFDRRAGFVVTPDPATAPAEAAKVLADLKQQPDDADSYLEAARIHERETAVPNALRYYARAADLFRQKTEISPDDPLALAGLGETLAALGRFAEAESTLERAGRLETAASKTQLSLARARLFRDRAWFSVVTPGSRFSSAPFLEQLVALVLYPPAPAQIDEARRCLDLAKKALDRLSPATNSGFLLERAAFRSFDQALRTAFDQIQTSELRARTLRQSLYSSESLADLAAAAQLPDAEPRTIAAAAFAHFYAENQASSGTTTDPSIRFSAARLQSIAEGGSAHALSALEHLGAMQLHLFRDFSGAQRTLRQAVALAPARHRAWELLVLAAANISSAAFVAAAEERLEALPQARSSVLLTKAYERAGDMTRAELTGLSAVASYPNDFLVHLTFAALLLKDENVASYLWRIGDSVNKAEKQLGTRASRQHQLDFVLTKGIYLALSDQPEQARQLLRQSGSAPEIQELLRLLD